MICADKIMSGVTFHASQTREHARSDAPQVHVCVSGQESGCSDACVEVDQKNDGEKNKIKYFVCSATLERDSSISLVMVLLIEGGLAEEPRATLGCAGGKGHCLQHCIENDKDNSQDRDTTNTI